MAYRMQRAAGLFQTAPVVSSCMRASLFSSRSALATHRFVRSQSHLSKSSGVNFTSFPNIVNGKPRFGSGSYKGENPSNKEQLWDVPIATSEEVDEAVAAAKQAFPAWSRLSQQDRVKKIKAWVDDFIAHEEELKEVLVQETGKPRAMADLEIRSAKSYVDYHFDLEIPEERHEDEEKVIETRYSPLGVTAAITPWNFPLILTAGKLAPSLVAGNTMIVKPSPYTPYTVAKWIEIAQRHLPPGVLQVLNGENSLGPMLVDHPDIAKVSFTGSIATGKKIMASAAKTLKRITLELGGNDPAIVLPDVDIEKVAPQVVKGALLNSGQMCVASKRLYVHQDIYDRFLEAMAAAVNEFKVGPANEDGVTFGPCQNEAQFHQIQALVKESQTRGDKFVTGNTSVPSSGFFVSPTIINNPPNDSRLILEEPFGPIVPVQPWSDEEELLHRVNDINTGLASSVWSKDVAKAKDIGSKVDAGSVYINSWSRLVPQGYFEGRKESGVGGEWGPHSLEHWSAAQATHIYK